MVKGVTSWNVLMPHFRTISLNVHVSLRQFQRTTSYFQTQKALGFGMTLHIQGPLAYTSLSSFNKSLMTQADVSTCVTGTSVINLEMVARRNVLLTSLAFAVCDMVTIFLSLFTELFCFPTILFCLLAKQTKLKATCDYC